MDTIEKVYCTGHDNNDALVSAALKTTAAA